MQMVPFAPKPLAARKQKVSSFNAALTTGVSSGFPVFSIKGKVFHLVRGDEKTLMTKKEYNSEGEVVDTGDPAASIEVVLLNANPALSRVYYSKGYEEGSDSKPDCYSNNGKTPEADAVTPQASNCATCPHSQYGSRVSENGNKGWACANSRRMAVAAISAIDDPILIRVPGASLKALVSYAKELDGHGYQFNEVVTKIGFDYSVAHPALTFKAIGVIPADALENVIEIANGDTVAQIIGTQAMPARDAAPESVAELPKKAVEAPKPAAKPKAAKPADTADLDEVVAKAEAKPAAKPVKVEAPEQAESGGIADSLDEMLGDVSFDD